MATLSPPSKQAAAPKGGRLIAPDSSLIREVSVTLQARLGQLSLPVSELTELAAGSVLSLGTRLDEPVELMLNGAVVARAEIVAVDDMFGLRIVEIAS